MKGKATYIPRSLSDGVLELNAQFPCVLLTGARQVGKSTLLRALMPKGMKYVTLDDFMEAERAEADPVGFLESYGTPLCIDEIQYVPKLMRAIKLKVDADRRPGMYWLTGSQKFRLMIGVSESLAGRMAVVDLHSLSQREITGQTSRAPLFSPENLQVLVDSAATCSQAELEERIWRGGYPELHRNPQMNRQVFFHSYLQTYIERDVSELSRIENQNSFYRLVRSAAARTGQQLVYSNLAKDAGVSPNTAKAWVSILETSGIITLLEPYYTSTPKRLSRTPKLYFNDTGLCCWLCGLESPAQLAASPYAGAMLETWVFNQLVRNYADNCHPLRISYYREKNGAEIDFLLELGGKLIPMEVKHSTAPALDDLKTALRIPPGYLTLHSGIVFHTSPNFVSLGHGNVGFPISAL